LHREFPQNRPIVNGPSTTRTYVGQNPKLKPKSSLLQLIGEKHDNVRIHQGSNRVSAVDEISLIPGEVIQIKLKDTIPTSQFWTDVAHNGNQIDFIGNE
jgi:hypothetical protein